MSLDELKAKVDAQGNKVRELKAAKASKDEILAAVDVLKKAKADFEAAGGVLDQPAASSKDKKKKGGKGSPKASPKASPKPSTAAAAGGPLDALKAKVDAQGSKVRELKAAKASKDDILAAVEVLKKAKADFEAAGGVLDQPAASSKDKKATAAQDKKGSASQDKEKAAAKEAEKEAKKAARKAGKEKAIAEKAQGGGTAIPAGKASAPAGVVVYPGSSVAIRIAAAAAGLRCDDGTVPSPTCGAPMTSTTAAVATENGIVGGRSAVLAFVCSRAEALATSSPMEAAQAQQWMSLWSTELASAPKAACAAHKTLNDALLRRTYLAGNHLTCADIAMYEAVHPFVSATKGKDHPNLKRWFDHIQHNALVQGTLAPVDMRVTFFVPKLVAGAGSAPAAPAAGKAPPAAAAAAGGEEMTMQEKQLAKKKAKEDAKAAKKAAAGDAAAPVAAEGKKKGAAPSGDWNISHLNIRVGTIVKCWPHPESDKLWCEEIDVGESAPRQIASGLRAFYPKEEELTNRKVLVLANLKPRKLAGFASNGMVLCASSADKSQVKFVEVPAGAVNGERVTFKGFEGEFATPSQVDKKKVFEAVSPGLVVGDDGSCTWNGTCFETTAGICTAPGMAGAHIS